MLAITPSMWTRFSNACLALLNNMDFVLHPQLAKDCMVVCDLGLCRVLLMNQAAFPWLILVPRIAGARELHALDAEDYASTMNEVRRVADALQRFTGATKMNVAALGNMVEQLHIHVVARFTHDAAWPNPVWNSGVQAQPYSAAQSLAFIKDFQALIA